MIKKYMLKSMVALSASLVLVGVAPVTTYAQEDEVIATVGDTQITKEDLYIAMKNVSGSVTLRTLMLEIILEQNVEDAEALYKNAEEEVQQQIEEAGGEEVFTELLNRQMLGTVDQYTYQVYVRNLFQEVVESNIDMSDEAIKNYYDNEYTPMMEAQHILVETEEEALEVIERINNGEEFDAVAQEVSLDGSAQNGGLLQPFTTGQMVPEFEEAVKSLENGEMTQEPVQSQFGFHVIRTINNGNKQPLEEIREEIENQYVTSKFADTEFAYKVIAQMLVDTGYDIKDDELKDAVADLVALLEKEETTEEVEDASETEDTEAEETEAPEEDAEEDTEE